MDHLNNTITGCSPLCLHRTQTNSWITWYATFSFNWCNVLTHHGLCSFPLFSNSSLCYCLWPTSPLSSLLSCHRKFSQLPAKASLRLQEVARTSLAEAECSVPVGVCQSQANKGCCSPPQSFCYIHSNQQVKNLNTAITGAVSLKLAGREEKSDQRLPWLIWSSLFIVSKCYL